MGETVENFKNILVIDFGQLGDVILSLAALRALREKFAGSRITLMLGRPAGTIAKLAGVADEYILVDRVALRDGNKLSSIITMIQLTMDIRRRSFDLVVDLHSLSETNILGFAAGIKLRLYADRKGRSIGRLANFPIKPPVEDRTKHAAHRYMDVIRPLGIDVDPVLTLDPGEEDIVVARSIVDKHRGLKLVGMFLGAGHPSRRWPLEKFAELAHELASDRNVQCFVFLGPEEAGLLSDIETMFPPQAIVLDKLGLLQLFAVYTFLDVVIGNDTGPMHLAAASPAHLVLISHESAPDEFLPLTDRLTVIRSSRIDEIEVAEVFAAVRDRLGMTFWV